MLPNVNSRTIRKVGELVMTDMGVKRAKLHKFSDFSKFSGPDFINITVRYIIVKI